MKFIKTLILITILAIPLSAYVDTIRIGTYPFQQYLAICLWEAGLVWIGIAISLLLKENSK